jgi:hypothetical protein
LTGMWRELARVWRDLSLSPPPETGLQSFCSRICSGPARLELIPFFDILIASVTHRCTSKQTGWTSGAAAPARGQSRCLEARRSLKLPPCTPATTRQPVNNIQTSKQRHQQESELIQNHRLSDLHLGSSGNTKKYLSLLITFYQRHPIACTPDLHLNHT